MPRYEVVTPLKLDPAKKPIAPGKLVELDEEDGEQLAALGAVRPAVGAKHVEKVVEKTLAQMSKAELEAVAAVEGADLSAAKTNPERVTAIEAARAAKAAAGQSATE